MAASKDEAAREASKNIEKTIVQLKGFLEEIAGMRVECAKLEFDMLKLYHTSCPDELESLREDQQNANISDNAGGHN